MAALIVQISWTAANPTTGITGYNVYLVNGAPENTTKTLLAFVSGVGTTTYNYTGIEGTQYQFEVRATNGTNESVPLEVFYPTGTTLYTPTLITPTGKPMQIVRDTAYLTKDEYIGYPNGLKLTTSSPLYTNGFLDTVLQMASEQVNRYVNRHFNTQTIDEVKHGIRIGQDMPKLISLNMNEGPIQVVNRIDIQVLKFFINFDLSYMQLFPETNLIQIVPFLGGNASGIPLPSAALIEGLLGKVWVNYTFGYDVIPTAVKMATGLYATKIIGMQENPVSAAMVKFGRDLTLKWDNLHDPLVTQAQRLLEPYRINTWRRP